jgi:hypothetical protein
MIDDRSLRVARMMPDVERIDATAARAVQTILAGQPNTPAKIAFAWRVAAGAAFARAADVDWSADGTLRVRAHSTAWRQEITRARPLILTRLTALLGPEVIRRLVVSEGA